jgi:NAD(P)-dependent dehydrogenase (short-subunit alcohol dehydrogenase family)
MMQRLGALNPRLPERATASSPGHRLIPAGDIAATVLWLWGSGAGAINGQAIAIDDGFTAQ